MAQLVSSRLVVHSAYAARFVPAACSASSLCRTAATDLGARRPSAIPQQRTFLSTASTGGISRQLREGQQRRTASTLSPAFFTSAAPRSGAGPGPVTARLGSSPTSPNGRRRPAALGSASYASLSLQQADSDTSSNRPRYAPASDDPTVVETELLPKSLAAGTSPAPSPPFRPAPTPTSLSALLRTYQQLAKARLTFLVVLTAMAPYALCPPALSTSIVPHLVLGYDVGGLSTLLALASGTALCSASANALNQLLEAPYDAQMPRTRARPLPRRALGPLHAFGFAVVCGLGGTALLWACVNPLTAALGLANVVLYAGVYTPLKRLSIVNTWVGSAVGALPPLMGWTACTGTLAHGPADAAGWVLAALLFAWQFPHFNSLAHSLRAEYARGGYRMMSVLDPALNRRVSLRYALLLLPLCSVALPLAGSDVDVWSWLGLGSGGGGGNASAAGAGADSSSASASAAGGPVVEPVPYALLSAPINAVMIHAAYRFWREGTDKAARWCFWVSLVHLPAVMLLAMACKRGLWNGVGEAIGMGTTRVPAPAVGRGERGPGGRAGSEAERMASLDGSRAGRRAAAQS